MKLPLNKQFPAQFRENNACKQCTKLHLKMSLPVFKLLSLQSLVSIAHEDFTTKTKEGIHQQLVNSEHVLQKNLAKSAVSKKSSDLQLRGTQQDLTANED